MEVNEKQLSRSKYKRERNANQKETRPSAKLSYARVSVQKACFVLDAIRGKDVQTALAILEYNPRYASSIIKKLLELGLVVQQSTLILQDTHLQFRMVKNSFQYMLQKTWLDTSLVNSLLLEPTEVTVRTRRSQRYAN